MNTPTQKSTRFSDQKVLVTGATRGIGRAISLAFLAEGATLIGVYAGNDQAAESFRQEGRALGPSVDPLLYRCNVADHRAVEALFEIVEKQHGHLEVLVNCAGIRRDSLTALMNPDQWQAVIDTNLTGTFNMCRQAVPLMLPQKYGRIVNITSPVARLGFQGQANYAASKAGQIAFTRSLAKETARKKITVNCISPGFIDTDFIDDLEPEQLKAYKKLVPMRRFGTVTEVAESVLFLASPGASYITGSVLEVTGGL